MAAPRASSMRHLQSPLSEQSLFPPAHSQQAPCFRPHPWCLRRGSVRPRAGYRWSAGTNGRRLREALLDNVDPAAPAEPADSAWRPLATPAVDEAPPSSSDSGTAAAESRAESAWRAASQNGASTSGRPAEAAAASNGAGKQRRSADDSGWGSGLGRVPDDWGSAPPGDAKGAGHHGSTWAGLAGAGVGGSSQNGSHPEGSSGEEAWPDAGGDVSPELETEEAPDIVKLRPQEVAAILPVVPRASQITHCFGSSTVLWQRLGWSALGTLLTLKAAALAAGTFTFPLWFPSLQAGLRNVRARGRFRHVGLWRVSVLGVEVEEHAAPRFREPNRAPSGGRELVLRLLVGDASGARSEVAVPHHQRYNVIRRGEAAELLVLSNSRAFSSFKALKEVYLPECGVWVADYPFMDSTPFLDLSLEIERERQAQHNAAPL